MLLLGPGPGGIRPPEAHAAPAVSLAKLPLSFVVNRGQLDRRVAFAVPGRDASALFTRRGVAYVLDGRYAVKVDFVGARPVQPTGQGRLPGTVSVFKGRRQDWHTAIPTYRRIVYRDLWPGVDLVWSGAGGRLKYDVLVRPGADLGAVRLRYEGATLSLRRGGLLVHTPVRTLREGIPVGNARLGYSLHGDTVGFRAGGYDRSRMLRIDPPSILYAGFLGGSSDDFAGAIAVDANGAAYVTGYTYSNEATFPETAGAFQPNAPGAPDAFVAKVRPSGKSLAYCSFLGGNGDDLGHGIAVDSSGDAFVTGVTASSAATFPATPGALDQPDYAGNDDAFVAEVNPSGTGLVYAGYLGGSQQDAGYAIAVDGKGRAYVTGLTLSTAATFPDTPGILDQTDNAGDHDAFVAKVAADGSHLLYARFVGGARDDWGNGIGVDGNQHAYITGITDSHAATFPDTPGALDQSNNAGSRDAFVAKVSRDGKSLVYAGFLGGGDIDEANGIAVGPAGGAYVIGTTRSTAATFPDTAGALAQSDNAGESDAFVAKVSKDGQSLAYCGFFGGVDLDEGEGIAVDGKGRAFVTGSGDKGAFVAEVKQSGLAFAYTFFIAGSGGKAIAIDGSSNAYVFGQTASTAATFPNTPNALDQPDNAGGVDTFVAKISAP